MLIGLNPGLERVARQIENSKFNFIFPLQIVIKRLQKILLNYCINAIKRIPTKDDAWCIFIPIRQDRVRETCIIQAKPENILQIQVLVNSTVYLWISLQLGATWRVWPLFTRSW